MGNKKKKKKTKNFPIGSFAGDAAAFVSVAGAAAATTAHLGKLCLLQLLLQLCLLQA
jgi:hypothetical protein